MVQSVRQPVKRRWEAWLGRSYAQSSSLEVSSDDKLRADQLTSVFRSVNEFTCEIS